MAGVGYTNTVPLGREGTGASQILGASSAVRNFLSTNEQNRERLLREQQSFQQRSRGYEDQFNKDILSLNDLAVSSSYQNELSDLTNALVKQGAELKSKGVNPYNSNQSPQAQEAVSQWSREVAKVKQAKLVADKLTKHKEGLMTKYRNGGRFDYDEFMDAMNFEQNNSLEDLMSGKVQMPEITERLDIGKEIGSRYGQVYSEIKDYERDASGNIIQDANGASIEKTIRSADQPRIQSAVINEFADGTPFAREVDRDLRKVFGKDASTRGLLRTTDRDEIRSILDGEFRNNTTELNPIVELMSKGKIPSIDSPEYEDFLDMAVNEQLKAETILDEKMQYAGNVLMGKVNPREFQKLDFSTDNQRMKRESNRVKSIKDNLTIDKLRSQKARGWKTDSGSDTDVANITDVTINSPNGLSTVVAGATSGSTTEFEYNPTKSSWNVDEQKFDTNKREKAKLMSVGVVAVDKSTGQVYPGDPRDAIGKSNYEFKTKAQVRSTVNRNGRVKSTDFLEEPEVIANTLAGQNKKFADASLSNAKNVLEQFNSAHSKALKATPSGNEKPKAEVSTNKKEFKSVPKGGF